MKFKLEMPPQDGEKYPAVLLASIYDDGPTARALLNAMADGVKSAGGTAVRIEEIELEMPT